MLRSLVIIFAAVIAVLTDPALGAPTPDAGSSPTTSDSKPARLDAVIVPNAADRTGNHIGIGVGWKAVPFGVAGRRFAVDLDVVGTQACHERDTKPSPEAPLCTFRMLPYFGISTVFAHNTSIGLDSALKADEFRRFAVTIRVTL